MHPVTGGDTPLNVPNNIHTYLSKTNEMKKAIITFTAFTIILVAVYITNHETMPNFIGDKIDVTSLILKGYQRISENKIKNPHPHIFTDSEQEALRIALNKHLSDGDSTQHEINIIKAAKYIYSYLPGYDFVEVFSITIPQSGGTKKLYFRWEENRGLILPYEEHDWVRGE